jgi:hypothetical protein
VKNQQAINLLNILKDKFSDVYIVIPVPEHVSSLKVENAIQSIIESGYACYIENGVIGTQIVVTDKRNDNAESG